MPQIYEYDPQHVDGTRYAGCTEGERVMDDLIHECRRSLEAIREAKLHLVSPETVAKVPLDGLSPNYFARWGR